MNTIPFYAAPALLAMIPGMTLAERAPHRTSMVQTQSVAVSFADLNLASDAGVKRLTHRVKLAAAIVCDVPTYEVRQSIAQAAKHCFNDTVARATGDIDNAAARARAGGRLAEGGMPATIRLARR